MDEDLKIIVTSELEADEQASAQRISAQLPDIAKLINQKSKIKVQVEVDNSNVQTEAQKFSKELSKAAQTHKVGVSVGLDRDSVKKMQAELNSLKVNPDISHAMTAQLEKMGIQIDRISGRWEQVNGQEERMLSLSIQGTDQLGRSVSYLQTYDAVTGDINTHLTNVTMNLEKQRQVEAQIAAKAKTDNESRISYLTKQKAVLSDIQASYTGATSAKPVQDTTHLDVLNSKYSELEAKIQSMISTSGQLDKVQRANIEAEIASLKQLVKEYQNAEYVATKLRTKDIGSIKTDQFAALETLEKRLQSAGTLTEEFKSRIGGLRGQLENAFDPATLTAFLNSFDKLEGDIATFQEQLRGVNAIYTQIIGVENKMTRTKSAMVGLDPTADKEKLAALNEQLALYRSQKQALESQLAPYSAIIQYARQAEAAERARLENEVKLKFSEAELADKAREIEQTMQRIPSTVKDLEVRFGQLVAPTDNLIQKMQMLRETEEAYQSAGTDSEKIAVYERLQFLLGECNKEISELSRVQRGDVLNFKFDENLMKAKADLETIGRQWSALKQDPGLNAQFRLLLQNLREVNNQADLTKWTSQFSKFKSEVKAAGKNVQSLGDVLKNNVSKVLQWVSATTLLFRAFSLLKSAISTVVALDTAMIDLRKTTEATEAQYRKFYLTANETAKSLGVTTEEVISQTAEWSRLGYTMEEAAKLAENSAIFKAISPEMDISTATDGLVSIIKAFDIDVDDTMDGIISKVNAVGNAFAVTNSDIVEALTRSSAAMSAANNTFDETVALATAAIEITRDASSVGNALKTISMRIRGYDEETEEYVGGVEELTGAIADLTKTASNNNRGISLFEEDDPETYRSTYDILADIADIWDELTDKNRADLLDKLFGKQRAQVGAAMLSNFDQASAAIDTMAESANSAEKEMENVYQSLDYKLNKLSETWVGVAQNLFDTDQMKLVVDGLTLLSNGVAGLTNNLGLFGTTALLVFGVQFIRAISTAKTAMDTAKVAIAGLKFDPDNLNEYVYALSGLNKQQQEAVLNTTNLSEVQKAAIMKEVAAIKEKTMVQLASILKTSEEVAMNKLNIASIEELTMEKLDAALASKQITQAEYEQIIAAGLLNIKNMTLSMSFKTLKANALAAMAAMATNPMTWIMGAVALISLLVNQWQKAKQAAEDARQEAIEAANAATTLSDEIVDLTSEYLELSEAVKTDNSAKEDLLSTQDKLIEKLDLEKGRIEELTEEYGSLTDAIKAAAVESLQESERDLRGGLNALEEELLNTVEGSGVANKSMNHIITTWSNDTKDINHKGLNALVDAGYISSGSFANLGMELYLPSDGDFDLSTVDGAINAYERLGKMLDVVADAAGSDNEVYDALYNAYNKCSSAITGYTDSITALNNNLAEQYMLQGLIGRELPATEEEFNQYRQSVIDAAKESGEFVGSNQDIADAVDSALRGQSRFATFYADELTAATENTGRYTAKLSELTDILSELRSSYSVLEDAQEDMADGGGLSAETIEALADAEENYLEYLYEENGLIKLNTDAWKENANAKMQSEMGEIQKEIDSLVARNAELQESIAYYEEQRQLGSDGGLWSNLISQSTNELNANNEAIAENQKLLSLYGALYGDITGEMDAYAAALHNFTNVANSIDSISSSFQTLADLQAAVADGFTMSLEKALEFAAVYPEILNNAQVSADGQITLNEGVVNTFIQGKKAELDTQIDAQIAQLEADKAVLEAKMQAAQAQLDLAKNVGEGEGQISKELAEYRINAGNAVAEAMIAAGIDEATAFKLAALAMAQNAEEFNIVAAEVCRDVNGNFNEASYNLAQTIYNNLTNVKTDLASVARQAHHTALAIAGIADGTIQGSSAIQGGSGGGTGQAPIKISLTGSSFEGTDYTYEAKESNLDDFIADLELDISSYEDAIAQINGQIATLQALKNIPLKEFKSDTTDGSSSSDEVEEYIADIDKYREAVERLRKAQEQVSNIELQIEESDNLKEKILLTRQLIGAYEREQEALHDLNNERDATIEAGVQSLRELGFAVEYNADTNDLWISNMEHLNELTADSKGNYDSLQEATNALREDTEGLIETITDLNEENRDGSSAWKEVASSISDAREQIMEYLSEIVQQASDAVDSIQNVYDTLHDAADEYAASGFITVDTLQSIIALGQQYVAYLIDENGQLVINEERIQAVIAARTQQLAIESSLAYVEALRMAKAEGDIATLNNLLYATEQATNATWGFVYANLGLLDLTDEQRQAAIHNINTIRALADTAIKGIGAASAETSERLNGMKQGLDDILQYVMDMMRDRIEEQIEGLEGMKDEYAGVIELQKESLRVKKEEISRQKTQAEKLKEIAKLQARIDLLDLDGSREAQAEKAVLLDEMAELQSDLEDDQAEYAVNVQTEALDKMEEAYLQEKDSEIEILEDSISSTQKLYDMAIDYIESNWSSLKNELIQWNYEVGSSLQDELVSAWDAAYEAAERYGSFTAALGGIDADIEKSESGGNTVVSATNYDTSATKEESIHAIIKEMYANSQAHHAEDAAGKKRLNQRNLDLGAMLAAYGITAIRGNDGVWYVDKVGGELLYEKYRKYIYHDGGIVGGGDIKSNEQLSLLKDKEWVLSEQMVENLKTQIDRINRLSDVMSNLPGYVGNSVLSGMMKQADASRTVNYVTNNSRPIEVNIGDTVIHGADQSTVEQHIAISRDTVSQIAKILKLKL